MPSFHVRAIADRHQWVWVGVKKQNTHSRKSKVSQELANWIENLKTEWKQELELSLQDAAHWPSYDIYHAGTTDSRKSVARKNLKQKAEETSMSTSRHVCDCAYIQTHANTYTHYI